MVAHMENVIVLRSSKQSHRLQGNKPDCNSPEPSEPCLRYLHQRKLELSGTLRNAGAGFEGRFLKVPEIFGVLVCSFQRQVLEGFKPEARSGRFLV